MVSGVPELLSVVVRSMVGLLGDDALVSVVLELSMVVSGLSFVSVAVGAGVGVTVTCSSCPWGDRGLPCASKWRDGAAVAVLCDGVC